MVNLRVEGAGEARTIDDFGVALFGGGGLALQLTGGFALRAMAATARSDLRLSDGSTPRQSFRRTFVGGDLQFGFLNPSTIIPYVAVGAAAVKINPDGAGGGFTRFAPRAAIGVNVLKAGLPTAIMLEVGTWIYRFDRFGYDRIQADVTATLGLAFAIPF